MKLDTLELAQEEGRAPWSNIELVTKEFTVFHDAYPVTEGHTLVVPKVNHQDAIIKCVNYAVMMGQQNIDSDRNDITGYNIGINIGVSAGQTVMYPHVHLIFRRDGDCEDPTGGVRNVIPGKGNYKKEK